jgi:hypothetical protein
MKSLMVGGAMSGVRRGVVLVFFLLALMSGYSVPMMAQAPLLTIDERGVGKGSPATAGSLFA